MATQYQNAPIIEALIHIGIRPLGASKMKELTERPLSPESVDGAYKCFLSRPVAVQDSPAVHGGRTGSLSGSSPVPGPTAGMISVGGVFQSPKSDANPSGLPPANAPVLAEYAELVEPMWHRVKESESSKTKALATTSNRARMEPMPHEDRDAILAYKGLKSK